MGRKTWFSIPEKFRPLPKRINIVLSKEMKDPPEGASLARGLGEAVSMVTGTGQYAGETESIYIIGGSSVYQEALNSVYSCRVYLTSVLATMECDTFLPELDENKFKQIENCEDIPEGTFSENGLDFKFEVYERHLVEN